MVNESLNYVDSLSKYKGMHDCIDLRANRRKLHSLDSIHTTASIRHFFNVSSNK